MIDEQTLENTCPKCGAAPGWPCTSGGQGLRFSERMSRRSPHKARTAEDAAE